MSVERIGNALDWAGRFKELPATIRGIISLSPFIAIGWGWIVNILDGIPIWAAGMAGVSFALLVACLFVVVRQAWLFLGVKKLDIAELGKDCIKFKSDVFDYLVARQRAPSVVDYIPERDQEAASRAMHESWAKGVIHSHQTSAELVKRFASRAIALSHLLKTAGIKPPDLWGFDHRAADFAAYVGAVGELLERGLLVEAKQIDRESHRTSITI